MPALPPRLAAAARTALDPAARPPAPLPRPLLAVALAAYALAAILLAGAAAALLVPAALLALALALRLSRRERELAVARGVITALEELGDGVAVSEPATLEIVAATPAAAGMTGTPEGALTGSVGSAHLAPEERAVVQERARLRAAGAQPPSRVRAHVALPGGGTRPVEVGVAPVDIAGRQLLVTVNRDASDHERAQEAQALLAALVESVPAPVRVEGPDGEVRLQNAAAAATAGPWESHPVREPGGSIRCVVMIGSEDRTVAAHDARDRRAADHEREHAELERLLSIAAHDLREPLRAIKGFGELLERESADDLGDRGREFLAMILQAGARLDDLLDGLSRYGRAGRPSGSADVDLERALDHVLRRLHEDIADRRAHVTHDALPVVRADPEGLQQVLEQLIGNALKFNDRAEPRVHVQATGAPEGWELTVLDDGIGVPERERDRIFDMFRRLHPRGAYPGQGVGLAVARRIVQRHGGRIWVDDAPQGGSAFHVLVPQEPGA